MEKIIVVGGGQAGFSTVAKLRNLGYNGNLTLICEENELPYQRPPLSKKYLTGEFEKERLYFRPQSFYSENQITVLLNTKCQEIDQKASWIKTSHDRLSYDHLVLATGSVPKKLPPSMGGDLLGVHTIRNLKDIHTIQSELVPGSKTLIVGGGYIGLETASALIAKGLQVTLVEAAQRILQRVAAPETANFFRRLHKKNNVKLIEGVGLEALDGDQRVQSVTLSDGSRIDVDLVIVGIGISPSVELAAQVGLDIENGIKVDTKGQTSCPNIWASGDCASFPHKNTRIRLESVQNAIDQSEVIAENIHGNAVNYDPVPWFWSDQYDAKLQIAGLNQGYDQIITRNNLATDGVCFWYMQGGRLLAVDAVNDPRSFMVGKRLLEKGIQVNPEALSNPDSNLKELLRQ